MQVSALTTPPARAAAPQARSNAIEKTALDTIERASHEVYYKDAAKEMYTGLASLRNMAAPAQSDAPELAERLRDVDSVAQKADAYAHKQEYYREAAPILYQALDDEALIAHGGKGTGSEKLEVAGSILDHASRRAHRQEYYSQASVTMYQALSDLRTVAQHQDPAVDATETAKLEGLDRMATTIIENAAKQPYWNGAAQVLYSGVDSLKAFIGP